MKSINRRRGMMLFCLFAAVFLILSSAFGIASADENTSETEKNVVSFTDRIADLEEEGIIPKTSGNFISLGDYEDTLAQLGYVRKIPLTEAENFAASVKLTWESASKTPDTQTAGCGVIFNSADGAADHIMVSVRMDGAVHVSGNRYYSKLSYGKFYYGLPSIEGSADLLMVYRNNTVHVYLNGEYITSVPGIPYIGNQVGLGILSGTYQDFGTRCKFEDIRLYIWQESEE